MVHHIFTIIVPLEDRPAEPGPTATSPRDRTLAAADRDALSELFGRLPMVHFASIQLFAGEAPRSDGRFQPCLVLESCIDGPVADYLDGLVALGSGPLGRILQWSSDYEPDHRTREAYLRAYLQEHLQKPTLYHIGTPNLKADHIAAGRVLRHALDIQLDAVVARGRSLDPPRAIVEQLRQRTNVPPSSKLHWHAEVDAREPASYAWFADPVTVVGARLRAWLNFFLLMCLPLAAIGGLAWVAFARGPWMFVLALIVGAALLSLLLRWLRGRNTAPVETDQRAVRQLKELEDFGVQNHMASLLLLKEGLARRLAIRAVLHIFNVIYRTWYTDVTPGRLQGLPTIHFAHWSLVRLVDRQGRQREGLLFLSNYDGSWETYLDDFLAFVFFGVVAIWANAEGFPWPIDGPTFKRWARGCMSPWQFWYQAYPDLTVLNIQNNDQIRRGLLRAPLSDAEARLWLARFGSIKQGDETFEPPLGAIETQDIQGLVFSGYRELPHAAYVILRVEQPDAARRWLTNLVPLITDARDRRKAELQQQTLAYNVAFTSSGLRALGLTDAALTRFSTSFQEGVAPAFASHRSRVLGDVGPNAPDLWRWGAGAARADILLMIFARTEATLAAEVRGQVGAFTSRQAGTEVERLIGRLLLAPTDPPDARLTREHFGFIDGISQPEIEGARRSRSRNAEGSDQLLKPGEFLLGYAANDGTISPGVPLPADCDPNHMLPAVPESPQLRDFGRNGSYLVLRHLAQDVAAFRRGTARAAGVDWATGSGAAEQVAARMIGRWRDGAPLMPASAVERRAIGSHAAAVPAVAATNQFGFTADPHGFGCPIGSHIRRTNPRDSLLADSTAALRSANRHRLLRRGRPYGPPLPDDATRHDGQDRGMAFICLNSDIERQFEFVQQNWINNPAFGGLYEECDPLMGTAPAGSGRLTMQANGVRERMNGIGQFVTVKGGDYFFLPGMSALRYLSSHDGSMRLPVGQITPQSPAPPPPQFPSALRRTLNRVEGTLRSIRSVWSARFPLLLAAALISLGFAPARLPAVAASLFVLNRGGLAAATLVAALAAFVVMIGLRLVLMYGWRSVPGRSRWRRPATWWQLLVFQALPIPVIAAAIHYSARDLANGSAAGAAYWGGVGHLLPAAVTGFAAAVAIMAMATALQALRPDSGAGLFFPPTRLLTLVAGAAWRPRRLWQASSRFSRLAVWIVEGVPEEIGHGYIDYRRRRILPGHVFAFALSLAIAAIAVFGAAALSPSRCAPDDWLPAVISRLSCALSDRIPRLAGLLFLLAAAGSFLAGLSFFLDRYRVSTLLVVGLILGLVASLMPAGRSFTVGAIDLRQLSILAGQLLGR